MTRSEYRLGGGGLWPMHWGRLHRHLHRGHLASERKGGTPNGI